MTRTAVALALALIGLAAPRAIGQGEVSPAAMAARAAFDRMKAGDFDGFAARIHPDDLKAFAVMVADLIKSAEQRNDPNTKLLTDAVGTSAELEKKAPEEVTSGFVAMMSRRIPGYDQLMKDTELLILGEVPAGPDTVAVVYRFVAPAPQAVLVAKKGEAWYLQLDPGYKQMASALRKALAGQVAPDSAELRLEKVEALGSIPEGDTAAYLVVRTVATVGGDPLEKLAVLPVAKGDPEWELLSDAKKSELEALLKSKFAPNLPR